ncbi:hypothetical protein [Niabella hirudinis]|uniref:hypothetical protein n=1 Tax=Niabella hirudinis TaxID=1285929 RepID=UPI003EC030AB
MVYLRRIAFYSKLKHNTFEKLYYERALTCSNLSSSIDKSIPLVARALAELKQDDVVIAEGHADSTGGRKALLNRLRPKPKVWN